ncbi:MAG: hypothetical protein AAGB28_17475, partial [Pseudomonadota bacterium]
MAVVLGEATRAVSGLPWLILCLLAIGDLIVSWPRKRSITVQPLPDVFVGERAYVDLTLHPVTSGVRGELDWPAGLEGQRAFDLSSGQAQVGFRAARRGTWTLTSLWLTWTSQLRLFEFVP